MSWFRIFWAFVRKDVEDALRSQTFLYILIGPVVLSLFFARFFAGGDVRNPVLLVCNPSGSSFIQALETPEFFVIRECSDWNECLLSVREGKAAGCVCIPENFVQDVLDDNFPELPLAVNESSLTSAAMVREGVRLAVRNLAGQELPADIVVTKFNEFKGDACLGILPMWAVFACLSGLMLTSSSLVEERENKTLEAVFMTPARVLPVLLGKISAGCLMAWLSAALLVFLNAGFKCGWAGSLLLLLYLFLGALAAGLGGAVLGLLAKNQSAANAACSMIYMLLFMPVAFADFSELMRQIAEFLPTWHLYQGVNLCLFVGHSWDLLGASLWGVGVSVLLLAAVAAKCISVRRAAWS